MKPLAIDLCAGLGGWAEGLIAAGWSVVGYDIFPFPTYPGQQVVQDIATIDTRKMRGKVQLVVASPPCQAYSYLAMPWSRSKDPNNSKAAKAMRRKWETEGPDNRLVNECFRIADEIGCPMVVENVKGMQPWFQQAKAHYGSFYLWGDVESIGGRIVRSGVLRFGADAVKAGRLRKVNHHLNGDVPPGTGLTSWFFGNTKHELRDGVKNQDTAGGTWFGVSHGKEYDWREQNPRDGLASGIKQGGEWWHDPGSMSRRYSSRSAARKAASQAIARIPFELALHVGRIFLPQETMIPANPASATRLEGPAQAIRDGNRARFAVARPRPLEEMEPQSLTAVTAGEN